MEETALVESAREGSNHALRTLYESHKEKIYALAFRYTRNKEDAEDILQDTFIKAFNGLDQFHNHSGHNFNSWLYRIAVNASIDLLRKKKTMKNKLSHPHFQDQALAATEGPDPADSDIIRDARERIQKVLNKLTPRQRMVFILRHFQQFSLKEIANYLNCTTGSVKKQLFRAVSQVKTDLKSLSREEGT